ncbi:MAG: TetR/AcrR family transcriptional regulator [Aeromicrobium erythreum]
MEDRPTASVARIRPGVFFTPPAALPRGRHGLARDAVRAAQRERLLIAATELLAASGYAALTTREVCRRGEVSLSVFYECFASKEDCVFAAYDRFIEVLVQRLVAITDDDEAWAEYIWDLVHEYLEVLRADPVVARAFQVEMDALGPEARRRRRDALTALAHLARSTFEERSPGRMDDLPIEAYLVVVYGIRQIASDAIDSGDSALATVRLERMPWLASFMGA